MLIGNRVGMDKSSGGGVPLPPGVKQVEYISDMYSLGGRDHGFFTDLSVGRYDRITCTFSLPINPGTGNVFGAVSRTSWNNSFALGFNSLTGCSYRWGPSANTSYANVSFMEPNKPITAVCDNKLVLGTTTVHTYSSSTSNFTAPRKLVLMNRSDIEDYQKPNPGDRGYPWCGRLYSLSVVDIRDGQIRANFIPVKKDGLGYFYDTVSQTLIPEYTTKTGVPPSHVGPAI